MNLPPTRRDGNSEILLDIRTFRSPLRANPPITSWKNDYQPDPAPENTFLGAAQWSWLEERFKEPADLRIVGTSIQAKRSITIRLR